MCMFNFLPQLFADWGVDYLKMDGCFADPLTFDEGYPTVTRALNESGRHIVFSCSWPAYQVWGGMKVKQLIFLSSISVVQVQEVRVIEGLSVLLRVV